MAKPIALDNAYQPRFLIQTLSTASGATVSSTGLTPTILISATDGSTTPINAALSAAASQQDDGGLYYTNFAGTDITTHLATFDGQTVYVVLVATDILTSHPVPVIDPRRPD